MRTFTFFKRDEEVQITRRNLPHWEQPEVCYFLTFRTVDSMPQEVTRVWFHERKQWLLSRGINPEIDANWHSCVELLSESDRAEFHSEFSTQLQEHLDQGHGECLLGDVALRDIVSEALHCFDEKRYRLGGFVIMPNHVHVLVQCLGQTRLKSMSYGWKRFTAREIHKRLNRRGHFWQGETYDHIVRTPQQFWHYRRYIEENPSKAKLAKMRFTLFLPEVDVPR